MVLSLFLTPKFSDFLFSEMSSSFACCIFPTVLLRKKHWESRSYRWEDGDKVSTRERLDSVAAYYAESAVDVAAAKEEVHLTPERLLYTGKHPNGYHILRSAQFIYQELPVRIAHRIMGFRTLPFIVGCNPIILSVHNMYLEAFRRITSEAPIEKFADEQRFSSTLRSLLDDHSHVISMLAEGFKECRHRIKDPKMIANFLNETLTSRLGLRLLVEHHLSLREDRSHHVGIIDKRMSLTRVVENQIKMVSEMFQLQYGIAPKVIVAGQTTLVFPYIRIPLDYILTELLKNAFRATVESRIRVPQNIPPIHITLASDDIDFWIRISDHAGGIPSEMEDAIWDYHVSTPSVSKIHSGWESEHGSSLAFKDPDILPPPTAAVGNLDQHIVLSEQTADNIELPQSSRTTTDASNGHMFDGLTEHKVAQSIHGFGFGLPTSRAYARYLGGDLQLYTIRSIGTDCYLRLRHIDSRAASFRI